MTPLCNLKKKSQGAEHYLYKSISSLDGVFDCGQIITSQLSLFDWAIYWLANPRGHSLKLTGDRFKNKQ